MNLATGIFSFCITMNFLPLDLATILGSNNHYYDEHSHQKNHSIFPSNVIRISHNNLRKLSSNNVTALVRSKRSMSIWEPVRNMLNKKPLSRRNTRFYLYTRQNPDNGQELCIEDKHRLWNSNFSAKRRTIILSSGWLDNRFFAKWIRKAIELLLKRGDYNVIYVGWRSIKELFVAAIMIKMYSDELEELIIFIKKMYRIPGDSIHCIGHSLGAFMCGFAGAHTYIGRVTVLDAGPRPWYESLPQEKRINRFQAGFVDVIHSDFNPKFSLGLTIPLGDVDFFPNAGNEAQTGCLRDKWYQSFKELSDEGPLVSLFQFPRYMMFCSHYRSHEWFFESIQNKQCQFVGVLCPTHQMYYDGECGCEDIWLGGHVDSTCAVMGFDADYAVRKQGMSKFSPQGKWYIRTSDFLAETGHHCEYQYQLIIKFGKFLPQILAGLFTVTIVTEDHRYSQKVVAHEVVESRSNGIRSEGRLTKLILRPSPLPLSKVTAIFLSLDIVDIHHKLHRMAYVTVEWVKIAPIQVYHNEPVFFCHLQHYLHNGKSNLLTRCPTT